MRKPFMVDAAAVVKELALRAVVLVIVACFPFSAVATFTPAIVTAATFRLLLDVSASCLAAIIVAMSVPPRYKGPVSIMLLPITAEPAISMEGAETWALNTALLVEIPSRSTLLLSAKLNVPDAGLTRVQVNSLRVTIEELVNVACFPANAAVSPVTSAMATGPEDDCAALSADRIFVDPTMSWPSIVQLPVIPSAPLT